MIIHPEQLNEVFWWVTHDWVTYKVPVIEGKVILAQDALEPGFVPDVTELWYSFHRGRRDRRKIADFASIFVDSAFFVNERVLQIFEDIFLKHGRIYPVRCNDKPHFIVLIDTIINAMDFERSKFRRLDMYPDLADDAGQTLGVVVKDGFKSAADIFRCGPKRLKFDLVVSDAFRGRYREAGFTGLDFRDTRGR